MIITRRIILGLLLIAGHLAMMIGALMLLPRLPADTLEQRLFNIGLVLMLGWGLPIALHLRFEKEIAKAIG
jgi:hypothetical protein